MVRTYNPKNPNQPHKQVPNTKDLPLDMKLPAKLPGWRISKTGKWYMETRSNRSDRRGSRI